MYRQEAKQEWDVARAKAFWEQVVKYVQQKDANLINFDYVSQQLDLRNPRYQGLHEIAIDDIVGSVGRYSDFTAAFFPKTKKMEERWANIAAMYLNPVGTGVPPIELYKVGSSYFVRDGNHRVSVSRQLGNSMIEAYVWEYPEPVEGISNDSDIDTLLIEAEKQDFLKFTEFDTLRPNHNIHLTLPGGYRELIRHILHYQRKLKSIDDGIHYINDVSLTETVMEWYDQVYKPTIDIIEQADVMASFPDRTPTDLFIFSRREKKRLESLYQHQVPIDEVVDIVEAKQRNVFFYLQKLFVGWLR